MEMKKQETLLEKFGKIFPICFVENFKEIFNNCEKEFPKNPKFIMTAFSWERC